MLQTARARRKRAKEQLAYFFTPVTTTVTDADDSDIGPDQKPGLMRTGSLNARKRADDAQRQADKKAVTDAKLLAQNAKLLAKKGKGLENALELLELQAAAEVLRITAKAKEYAKISPGRAKEYLKRATQQFEQRNASEVRRIQEKYGQASKS